MEECYRKHHDFGTPLPIINNSMTDFNISQFSLINGSSTLTALLFTSGDKNIGWRKDSHKILLFSTTNIDVVHIKDNGRVEPKGDGYDTCEKNRPLDLTTFGKVMNQNGFDKVVGMTALFNDSNEIYDLFNSHLYTNFLGNRSRFHLFRCPEKNLADEWHNQGPWY